MVLINNGSVPGIALKIKDFVKDRKNVIYHDFPEPIGVSYAYNFCISKYGYDSEYFIILHNDVLVTPNWFSNLIRHAENLTTSGKDFSAIFPRTNYCTELTPSLRDSAIREAFIKIKPHNKTLFDDEIINGVIHELYVQREGLYKYAEKISKDFNGMYKIVDELCVFCTLFHTQNFFKYKQFDNDFIDVGAENKLLHYKMSEDLTYPINVLDTYVHHNGNTTSDGIGKDFRKNFEQSEEILSAKIDEYKEEKKSRLKLMTKFMTGDPKILAIRDDGVGDIVMSMFALSGLKKVFPQLKIAYMTRKNYINFVTKFSCIDKVILVPDNFESKYASDMEIRKLSEDYSYDYDIVLNWVKYFEKINKTEHNVHRINQVIESINIKGVQSAFPEYNITEEDREEVKKLVKQTALKRVVVAPRGSCKIRSLSEDIYLQIIKLESERNQVIILDSDPRLITNYKEGTKMENVVNLCGKTKVDVLPAILSTCECAYVTDSGIFHIAGLVGTPVKAFFGTIDPDLRDGYYKSSDKNIILFKRQLPCAPCHDLGCASIDCMRYREEEIKEIVYKNV